MRRSSGTAFSDALSRLLPKLVPKPSNRAEAQPPGRVAGPKKPVPPPVKAQPQPSPTRQAAKAGAIQKKSSKKKAKTPKSKRTGSVAVYQAYRPSRLDPKLTEKPKAIPRAMAADRSEDLTLLRGRIDLGALAADQAASSPTIISESERNDVSRRIARGAAALLERPEPDPMGFRVGLDFGTSTTKIIICSDGAESDYALEVPLALQVDEFGRRQQHLWRTCVWLGSSDEIFGLIPTPSSNPIVGFKSGLIQAHGQRMISPGVSHNAACAAFLALMIAYVLGVDSERCEAEGRPARQFSRFHIGVPVACLDEDQRVVGFHRILQAAFRLAPFADQLSLARVYEELSKPLGSLDVRSETPYQFFEELAAVVAGYLLTNNKSTGPHIVVDVGAATLDVATIYIPDGEYPLEVYETGVDLLGAHALDCARHAGIEDDTFRAACQLHTRSVLAKTFRTKDYAFLPGLGQPTKPMIYVGGGRLSQLHAETYDGYAKAFTAPKRTPGVGRWLERDETTEPERLLLAWGLAQDPGADAIPKIKPPSEVVPILRKARDWESSFPGSDVC